ncbi:MAG: hypothetical protein V4691_01155 [Pseudomonadota bacterium]
MICRPFDGIRINNNCFPNIPQQPQFPCGPTRNNGPVNNLWAGFDCGPRGGGPIRGGGNWNNGGGRGRVDCGPQFFGNSFGGNFGGNFGGGFGGFGGVGFGGGGYCPPQFSEEAFIASEALRTQRKMVLYNGIFGIAGKGIDVASGILAAWLGGASQPQPEPKPEEKKEETKKEETKA